MRTLTVANRLAQQLSHDRHTIALALLVPSVIMTVLYFVFDKQPETFERAAPALLAVFPFLVMFLIGSISMLRERKAGTLERLMTLPIGRAQIVGGYLFTFGILAILQAMLLGLITLRFLGIDAAAGSELQTIVTAMVAGVLGTGFGLFISAFATSEFQVVQFLPAFVFPQILVCGLFAPKDQMAVPLQWFADITPPYYLVEAMRSAVNGYGWPIYTFIIIGLFLVASVVLAAVSIRRVSK